MEINFETIEKIWFEKLWPARKSKIEAISVINSQGKIDVNIKGIARPVFISCYDAEIIIGVSSFLMTGDDEWRLHGTWVSAEQRGNGIGRELIDYAVERIKSLSANPLIWTMARNQSVSFYRSNKFSEYGKIDGYEFGPHTLMSRSANG